MTVRTTTADILTWGQEAMRSEGQSLLRTASLLDQEFSGAVEAILGCSGKVVLTGMGKSGHIARKIAATFASTGTSSFFMHPSEALHGDSGMLESRDILLAIGFGGETREVLEVAKFARRQGVKVISITGKRESSLSQLSDYKIDGSIEREACPLNLAPTNSTTVALAIGDALAVSLMKARGFQERDFAQYHPEGSLGRKLLLVADVMRRDLSPLRPEDDVHTILQRITQHNYGIATVLSDQGDLLGVITDGDLRRAMKTLEGDLFKKQAGDLMSKNPKTILDTALALDAFRIMEKHSITSLITVDNSSKPAGLVRMYDLLAAKII